MAQFTPKKNLYKWEVTDEKIATFQEYNNNADKLDEMVTQDELPYTKSGNAAKFISSIYLDNDNNLFAYMSDGSVANLATMEQNDIAKLGDTNIPKMWLVARDYIQLRSPKAELVTEVNPDGSAKTTREMFNVGNFCNHAIVQSNATQTLTKDATNRLTILGSVVSSFPVDSFTGNAYKIPRTGIYDINIIAKVTSALTVTNSYVRFGFTRNRGGTLTDTTMMDEAVSSSYGTPFVGISFMYPFNKDDIVQPFITPLNENITIGSGTKFNIYFKGDSPTS